MASELAPVIGVLAVHGIFLAAGLQSELFG
jgi:hypothetical protein